MMSDFEVRMGENDSSSDFYVKFKGNNRTNKQTKRKIN